MIYFHSSNVRRLERENKTHHEQTRGCCMKHNGANQKLGWGREDGCVKRSCELGGQGSHAPSQAELHSQVTHKAQHTVWSPPFAPKRGSSCRSLPQHPIPLWCSRLISDLGPAAKETIPLSSTLSASLPYKTWIQTKSEQRRSRVKIIYTCTKRLR